MIFLLSDNKLKKALFCNSVGVKREKSSRAFFKFYLKNILFLEYPNLYFRRKISIFEILKFNNNYQNITKN